MKKLLFIGYFLHQKTRSSDFMSDFLKQHYQVDCIFLSHDDNENTIRSKVPDTVYDAVVVWLVPIGLKLGQLVQARRRYFFPMYDWLPAMNQFDWLKDFISISFCRTVHDYLKQVGLRSVYVQYAPPLVQEQLPMGDVRSMFFWKRRDFPAENMVMKIHSQYPLDGLYVHDVPDHMASPVKRELLQNISNIEYGKWFEHKDDLYHKMEESALFFAPRAAEGIGMSFLDAMSHFRCVIAPDNPTMNEYIIHGETGILYDLEHPDFSFTEDDVRRIQANLPRYMKKLSDKWQKERERVLHIIDGRINISETTTLNQSTACNEIMDFLKQFKYAKLNCVNHDPVSRWCGHALFGYICAMELKPKVLVELGTQNGCSFFSFCEGMNDAGVPAGTKFVAIDSWKGDPQTGYYNESVYRDFLEYAQIHYSPFVTAITNTFDKASESFAQESIDMLHIDGYLSYASVKHDFETWFPKVKSGGIILIHGLNDFGVFTFWEKMQKQYPENFAFYHSLGLGIIRKPGPVPLASSFLSALLSMKEDRDQETIRQFFANSFCSKPDLRERQISVQKLNTLYQTARQYREKTIELEKQYQIFQNIVFSFPQSEQPIVSIIVPCYNNFNYTRSCLASIALRSRNVPYEVIVADDHSTDETKNVEQYFRNTRLIENESGHKGFLSNVNYATQFAKGKYLLLLNNDTIVHENWLKPMVDTLDNHDDVAVCGAVVYNPLYNHFEMGHIVYHTGDSSMFGRHFLLKRESAPELIDADYVQGSVFLIRSDVWKRMSGFDPIWGMGYFEETDLCMRIKRELGMRIVCNSKSAIDHFESRTFNDNPRKDEIFRTNRINFGKRHGQYLLERETAAMQKYPNAESDMVAVFYAFFAHQWFEQSKN